MRFPREATYSVQDRQVKRRGLVFAAFLYLTVGKNMHFPQDGRSHCPVAVKVLPVSPVRGQNGR